MTVKVDGNNNNHNNDPFDSNQGSILQDAALSDIKVLDLADQKGVYCTKMLADLGADVIKVEPPGGDQTRGIGPFYHDTDHPEKSLFFYHFNTNKRGVTIDLDTTEGRDIFKSLAEKVDIIVETYQPDYLEKLGLGYKSLKQLNSGLIVTSITGFGQTGPWKHYKSSDLVALATGGLLHMCGWPDRPPQRMAGSQAHYMASLQAATATLLALNQRLRTGKGQHVDVSLQQSLPVCMQTAILVYEATKSARQRSGDEVPQPAQGVFPCKDGYIDIAQLKALLWWDRFVDWLDSEGAAADLKEAKWQDPFYRIKPEAIKHVNEILKTFLMQHNKNELFHSGQKRGVVIGPVNSPQDIANDALLKERGFFVPLAHPELGTELRYVGAPYKLSATPWRLRRRAPLIGEHNADLLRKEPAPSWQKRAHGPNPDNGNSLSTSALPLAGIRVVEFTEQVAGPMVGKALADYGAQVIIVENEERARMGSSSRHPGTGAGDLTSLNLGNHFNKFNTNKLSVTLNLKNQKGMEIARRLIGQCDVVISNFLPRVLEKWNFSYDELKKIKPDIILLTMPAFNAQGPYRDYRTLSWNLMALCGLDFASGFPDRPPIRANPWSHPDTSSQPFHALVATLAALYWRAVTGKGQHIEVCQYESTLCLTETLVFEYLVNGRMSKPIGNRLDYAAPHGVYHCKGNDEWCAIAVFTDEEWQSFCRVINRLDLIDDTRFSSLQERVKNADELDRITNAWTEKITNWQVMELMQQAGIASGTVEDEGDLLRNDPQLQSRAHWLKINHPEAGSIINEDWGFKLSDVPPLKWRHAPLLGEHNDLVLTEILGIPEAELNELIIEGVIA